MNAVFKFLNVSSSGYYDWVKSPESPRALENKALISKIRRIHEDSKKSYGSPRITAQLRENGFNCGENRVTRLMHENGIQGIHKRRFRVRTTDSRHDQPIANRVFKTEDSDTHPIAPNQVWASDISYIQTTAGVLYLAIVIDLCTRKLVGFSLQKSMTSDLLISAMDMAVGRQDVRPDCILHSDRGSQYASEAFREHLKTLGIQPSMSRKGNCYDNAYAESFFASLKKELVYPCKFKTLDEACQGIFEYIEVWYNRKRLHSSIGYLTPVAFEVKLLSIN